MRSIGSFEGVDSPGIFFITLGTVLQSSFTVRKNVSEFQVLPTTVTVKYCNFIHLVISGARIRINPHFFSQTGSGSGSALERRAGSEPALKSKFRSIKGSKQSNGGPWTLTMEAWGLEMEPWRIHRPVVANSHFFDEEQGQDSDPRIRIRR
jgi:hypothetical protein